MNMVDVVLTGQVTGTDVLRSEKGNSQTDQQHQMWFPKQVFSRLEESIYSGLF